MFSIMTIASSTTNPVEIVSASKWKAHYGIRATKSLALAAAGRLMPEDAGLWTARRGYCTRSRAIGRAESALIALYGIRSFNAIAGAAA